MHLSSVDLIVISFYFIGLALFGILVRRTRGFEDFAVARRSVPTTMVFASLCGACIGPGYSVGFAAAAYANGFAYLPIWLLFSMQTIVVGIWLAPRLREFQGAYTIGGVIRSGYGITAQRLAGMISVGLCVGFAGVLARAGGTILSATVGITLTQAVFLISGVGLLYAWTGGLKSVVATEGIQFCVILLSARSHSALEHVALAMTRSSWASMTAPTVLGLALLFFCGECLIPPYANRALSAASGNASRYGFILAGLFSICWFTMMATAGILGRGLLGNVSQPDSVLIQLARAVLPQGLMGMFLVALSAIVMSTLESLLNAGSVCLTRDLISAFGDFADRTQLLVARMSTLAFAAIAAWLALRAPSVIDGLLICYSIWAPTVLPVLIWRLLKLPTNSYSGVMSIVLGGLCSSSVLIFHLLQGGPPVAILAGLFGSLVGALVGYATARLQRVSPLEVEA
jgi:SSS family solute:Na+ symporter